MTDLPIQRLGLALDDDPLFAGLVAATRAAAVDLGLDVVDVRGPADEVDVDRVLIIGRPARHVPLLSSVPSVPRTVWSGEPLPTTPITPSRGSSAQSADRPPPRREPARLGRWLREAPLGGPAARWRARFLSDRLVRTNLAELAWAAEQGADIVVTSHDRAAILVRHGLTARVVPIGYHETLCGPLTAPEAGPRDIPIVSLGAASWHLRRGAVLGRFAHDRDGIPLRRLDGVWGAERASILRRSRVVLDVHRIPGSFIGVRLVLALAAGVAVVTEPMPDPRPFASGVTHVEVPTAELLDAARALAVDEDRRRSIVAAGQALLAADLRLTDSIRAIVSGPAAPVGTSGRRR